MFKNYFKVALRNMRRNKVNSFINIAGLAIAMACVILIVMYVQDELGYDKFFKDADHIFQVNMTGMDNQPNKMAAIIAITSKLSCGNRPFRLMFFGLLLIIGISLAISQLKIKTMLYKTHLLVNRFRIISLLLVQ